MRSIIKIIVSCCCLLGCHEFEIEEMMTVYQPVSSEQRTHFYKQTFFFLLYGFCLCFLTHVDVWVEELGPGVAGQHVDDDDLPPLLHVDQEVTQLPVILVDQVDALRTNLLKSHNNAACHQLQHIFIHTTGGVVRIMFLYTLYQESTCYI